jgi:hypothetical protein
VKNNKTNQGGEQRTYEGEEQQRRLEWRTTIQIGAENCSKSGWRTTRQIRERTIGRISVKNTKQIRVKNKGAHYGGKQQGT